MIVLKILFQNSVVHKVHTIAPKPNEKITKYNNFRVKFRRTCSKIIKHAPLPKNEKYLSRKKKLYDDYSNIEHSMR